MLDELVQVDDGLYLGKAHLKLCDFAVLNDSVWTEWAWRGRHVDGSPFYAGGVIIFGLQGDRIRWARIYTETAPCESPDLDEVLEEILSRVTDW